MKRKLIQIAVVLGLIVIIIAGAGVHMLIERYRPSTEREDLYAYFDSRGDVATGEIYHCKKDMIGHSYDKGILQAVSYNLQHSRNNVVVSNLVGTSFIRYVSISGGEVSRIGTLKS